MITCTIAAHHNSKKGKGSLLLIIKIIFFQNGLLFVHNFASLEHSNIPKIHSDQFLFFSKLKEKFGEVDYLKKIFEVLVDLEDKDVSIEHYLDCACLIMKYMNKQYLRSRPIEIFQWLISSLAKSQKHDLWSKPFTTKIRRHNVNYPFQSKEACSVLIIFHTKLIGQISSRILEKLLEGFYLVSESFFAQKGAEGEIEAIYFEIQNASGLFQGNDEKFIKELLPQSIIEELGEKDFVVPSNRELLLKNASWILKDLYPGDLPQVLIDFSKQTIDSQRFSLLICSVATVKSELVSEKIRRVEICIEGLTQIKEGNYIKESLLASLEIQSSSSISPLDGRRRCVDFILSLIGPFRDLNGGLIEKADENFLAFCRVIGKTSPQLKFFFDSISPQEMQATLPPSALKLAFKALTSAKFQFNENAMQFFENDLALSICVHSTQDFFLKSVQTFLNEHYPRFFFSKLSGRLGKVSCYTIGVSTTLEIPEAKRKIQQHFNRWLSQKKQSLRIPISTAFTSFDPRIGTDEETSYLHRLLFSGLMKIGAQGSPQHALAKSVEISNQGKHYRFHLRESLWSNGEPVTAEDFIYSWKTSLSHHFFSPLSHFFYPIKNAKRIKEGRLHSEELGVEAKQPRILDVYLEYPCSYFLDLCAHPVYSPIHHILDQEKPNWPFLTGEKFVCNGGFQLSSACEAFTKIKKNPRYWKTQDISLEEIDFLYMSEAKSIEKFKGGEVDALISPLLKCDIEQLLPEPMPISVQNFGICQSQSLKSGLLGAGSYFSDRGDRGDGKRAKDQKPLAEKNQVLKYDQHRPRQWFGETETKYLCFNCLDPLFQNEKIRYAISLIIDRRHLASVYSSQSVPHTTPFSKYFTTLSSELNDNDYGRIDRAKSILNDGLNESRLNIEDIREVELSVVPKAKEFAEEIVLMVNKKFNFCWKVRIVQSSRLPRDITEKKCQLSIYGWIDRIMDPSYFLDIFFSELTPINHSFWSHPKLCSLIKDLRNTSEERIRRELFIHAERILCQFVPMAPLISTPMCSVTQPGLIIEKESQWLNLLDVSKK